MVVNSKLEEENFYGGCNITYGKHYFPKKNLWELLTMKVIMKVFL